MPFKKGQSGNPQGRRIKSAGAREVEAAARLHGLASIERLVALAASDDERISLAANNSILDRAYGKPKQAIIGGTEDDNPVRVITEIRRTIVDPKQKGS